MDFSVVYKPFHWTMMDDMDSTRPHVLHVMNCFWDAQVEKSEYMAAKELREELHLIMRKALTPSVFMVLPIIAGAAPRLRHDRIALDGQARAMADLSVKLGAFAAMCGCPVAVLPVPALTQRGAPWAVLMVGCQRCDLQLAKLAGRLGAHIEKTTQSMIEVRAVAGTRVLGVVCMSYRAGCQQELILLLQISPPLVHKSSPFS
jgi:hypothetical protein